MIDTSLLRPATHSVLLFSDAHHSFASAASSREFPSRARQARRLLTALRVASGLPHDLCVHLGDLSQEPPESPLHDASVTEAAAIFSEGKLNPIWVPGNHDVGDKTDGTMPARPVTREALEVFEKRFGPQWQHQALGELEVFFLNSQVFNSSLPACAEQKKWLEKEMAKVFGKPIWILLHLPPFVVDAEEPSLGHYDNIAEPDRSWLLDLAGRFGVELMIAGHIHQRFLNFATSKCRYFTAPSPAFTRPGFSTAFASAPPPEQGRDDRPKLGFYYLRRAEGRTDVHFIRTGGATSPQDLGLEEGRQLLLTPPPVDLEDPRLGVTLSHPLAVETEIPIAWPAARRQKTRDDMQLLLLDELGPGFVRVPLGDVQDARLRRRLGWLRERGTRLIGMQIGLEESLCPQAAKLLDALEVQWVGPFDPKQAAAAVEKLRGETGLKIHLGRIDPSAKSSGKQLPRTRFGWTDEEVEDLKLRRSNADRLLLSARGWVLPETQTSGEAACDILAVFEGTDPMANCWWAAWLMGLNAVRKNSRLIFQPVIGLDRTMDVPGALLDPLRNPQPAFHALRVLQCLWHAKSGTIKFLAKDDHPEAPEWMCLRDDRHDYLLLAPSRSSYGLAPDKADKGEGRLVRLATGIAQEWRGGVVDDGQPVLLILPRGALKDGARERETSHSKKK